MPKDFYLDKIIPIIQPTDGTCGQASVAMVANVSVDDVIEVMGHAKGTQTGDIRRALRHFGFLTSAEHDVPHQVDRTSRSRLPSCGILTISKYAEDDNFNHAVVLNRAVVYDPALGAAIPLSTYVSVLLPRDSRWVQSYIKIKGQV